VILFNYERHASAMLRDHNRGRLGCLGRLVHQLTCGLFSPAPRLNRRHITVSRAPEPSDIWWENMRGGVHVAACHAVSWSAYLVCAAASAALQFYIAGLAETERTKRLESRQFASDTYHSVLTATAKMARLRLFQQLLAVVVTISNWVMTAIAAWLTSLERHTAASAHNCSLTIKLVLFYLANSYVVPILAVTVKRNVESTNRNW